MLYRLDKYDIIYISKEIKLSLLYYFKKGRCLTMATCITAYDFLRLFFFELYSKKTTIISNKLGVILEPFVKVPFYSEILGGITYTRYGNIKSSKELEFAEARLEKEEFVLIDEECILFSEKIKQIRLDSFTPSQVNKAEKLADILSKRLKV